MHSLAPSKVQDSRAPNENFDALGKLLQTCSVELMNCYGVAGLQPLPRPNTKPPGVLAGGDCSGSDLRGTVGLQAAPAMVAGSYEYALGRPMTSLDVDDWTCELANQLVGRLKNELLRCHGTGFSVNIPRRLWSTSTTELQNCQSYAFGWNSETLCVYLDALFAPATCLSESSPTEAVPDEGDLLLF